MMIPKAENLEYLERTFKDKMNNKFGAICHILVSSHDGIYGP